ncbi:MAG TPA: ribonuclease Y [Candidatus Paceibacterota bacterium]|nr:ribonuclease Y [Candidatus Paceibacterota bacterium]
MSTITLLLGAVSLGIGVVVGYFVRQARALRDVNSAEQKAKSRLDNVEAEAKAIVLEAKEKAAAVLAEAQNEEKERKTKITALEERLIQREESLDKKLSGLAEEEKHLRQKEDGIRAKETEVGELRDQAVARLEKVAGMSAESARTEIMRQVEQRYSQDLAQQVSKLERERRDEIEEKAGEIITVALQRYARTHVSELTTTAFQLTDDDVKGKIIGREGRNIRALERATGVEFVIDEAPDAIIISSFDPYRREVARLALQKLIKDGRIQPAKIEEKVAEAQAELQKRVMEIGEAAAMEVGVYGLPKEVIQLLGRLHFRTSYGQNVLTHSIEMAFISAMIAADLGLNVEVARKGALLHDIGKAIDHEVEGTHVELGRKILKKYGVEDAVIQAMQSHHEDYPYEIPEAYIVTAADVLSAARPGARRDTVENYIKRLGDLEKIALDFPGVKQAYAISAGRELRVFVVPEKVDDFRALELAREIANRIQSELKYPGEIKVTVVREMRAVEYAR